MRNLDIPGRDGSMNPGRSGSLARATLPLLACLMLVLIVGTPAQAKKPVSDSPTTSATIMDFGSQPTGSQTGGRVLWLTNSGGQPLRLEGLTLGGAGGEFPVTNITCVAGMKLKAGESCSVTVAFQPASKATYSAVLTFVTSAANSPHPVTLTGVGI